MWKRPSRKIKTCPRALSAQCNYEQHSEMPFKPKIPQQVKLQQFFLLELIMHMRYKRGECEMERIGTAAAFNLTQSYVTHVCK